MSDKRELNPIEVLIMSEAMKVLCKYLPHVHSDDVRIEKAVRKLEATLNELDELDTTLGKEAMERN